MNTKSLIVVLGMHRSGTSAITRGLQVMGVDLGDRMMPPIEDINPKGFWEDLDLNALNIQMMEAIDLDWHHLSLLQATDMEALCNKGYFLRAVELLRQKANGVAVFGFKDPRVAKLLPFWKEVFNYCRFSVSYVVAIRHPLSVAMSLLKRDGIAKEQSYLLWLGYIVTALMHSTGERRVLVDYDRLMQSPDRELTRIATCMDLELDDAKLQSYKTEFLDQGLRHTIYELNDLLNDRDCPPLVSEVYEFLLDVASDQGPLEAQMLQNNVVRWTDELERLKVPLMLVDKLLVQKLIATQTVTEREEQIASLNQSVSERDEQIASLNQSVSERDEQIASLNQSVSERDEQIASLNQAVSERDSYIRTLVGSKSWLITKPMRWAGRVVRGDFIAAMGPIKKMLNLSSPDKLSSLTPNDDDPAQPCGSFVTPLPIKPTHPVAVILPVYRDIEVTKRCILAAMPGILAVPDSCVVVINDASPDVGMQEMLEQLAAQWPDIFVLLNNENNLGFVGTVNRGLAYFPDRDVVLLNSDVIVPRDWLARLIEEAYSRPDIGTVTPFSNNATICSFPYFLHENRPPFNLDVDSIDAAFRHAKLPCVVAPTGVGFCMYIRRSCLDVVGYLNHEKFGRGYGEENDLCQRALKRGWLNIISPNLFAYHEGGVSFSSDKQALVDRAMRVIDKLHPGYHSSVQRFIVHDPLRYARVVRHIQLLAITAVPKLLHISHAVGGGVGQHIKELAQFFSDQAAHILLTPHGDDGTVSINLVIDSRSNEITFQVPKEYGSIVELLKTIGVGLVHIHHTLGLDSKIFDLPRDLNVPYILTVHDFYMLNGNPTLTDKNGRYPGCYSRELCNPLYPLPKGVSLESWREKYSGLINGAERVIFPSFATKAIFNQVYQTPNSIVVPHIEPYLNINRKPYIFTKKRSYIIGVLGAIGREKGADLLEEVGRISKSLSLPLNFKLLGYAYRQLKAIEISGPYKTQDLSALIQKYGIDIVFFPAQCPETYSYTLSYALDSGLPIIAPNIGAFPERLSGRSNTLLFNHLTTAVDLVKQINNFVEELSYGTSVAAPVFNAGKPNLEFYSNDYIQIASLNSRVVAVDNITKIQSIELKLLSGTTRDSLTWRSSVARALWHLYMNPAVRWVNYVIPYSVRRYVKRSLTGSPMHDIINR